MTNDTVKMTQVFYKCPIDGCDYETGEVEAIVAAPLLSLHANSHAPAQASSSSSKPQQVDRHKINANCEKAGSSSRQSGSRSKTRPTFLVKRKYIS